MHIPENYLSPSTCAVMTVAMVPVWTYAVRRISREIPKTRMPLLGVGAAFSFIGMMFNIPLPGGTTGHAVGGTLIALMLGPNAACISVTMALLIQALLFGDGGILAFGANCFNMAFVLPYAGYGLYRLISHLVKGRTGQYIGAAVGAYVGINAAALCAAIEFGIQPMLFTNPSGQALYCPYPLSISIPAMMLGHLTIAGLAELIFTTAVYAFIMRTSPDLTRQDAGKVNSKPLLILLAVLICAVPIGLLASGTAWGEWAAEELADLMVGGVALGYTPEGMTTGFSWGSLFPDYSMAGMPEWVAYILSAIIGIGILLIIFRVISLLRKKQDELFD